jgi:uncharacterized OsmC-like protein
MVSETRLNGMALDVLRETVSAIKKDPGLALCKFRARNRWVDGTENHSTVSDYFGAREEKRHQRAFGLAADEPPLLAGQDQAPNPIEYLLHALASCATTSIVAHASVRGIEIEELEAEVEGDLDVRGFLGLADDVPKGCSEIRVKFKAKTKPENLERLRQLIGLSPVFNTISLGTPVDIRVEPK